jgi:tRNA1Val (adenine37-N6)-methyltransferase
MKVTTDSCLFGAWVADKLSNERKEGKLIDVGTGTGLLSLMIAQKNPGLKIDAIEIDDDAYQQSVNNFSISPWKDSITPIHSDIASMKATQEYDVLVSNPPFYENELKSPDPKRKLAHHSGLSLETLLAVTKKALKQDGKFFILLPYKRVSEVKEAIALLKLQIREIVFVKQTCNHENFRVMIYGMNSHDDSPVTENEIVIKDENGAYTTTFSQLLQEYYL